MERTDGGIDISGGVKLLTGGGVDASGAGTVVAEPEVVMSGSGDVGPMQLNKLVANGEDWRGEVSEGRLRVGGGIREGGRGRELAGWECQRQGCQGADWESAQCREQRKCAESRALKD